MLIVLLFTCLVFYKPYVSVALAEDASFVEKLTPLETIDVEGNSYLSDRKIIEVSGLESGMSMLAVDSSRVLKKLRSHAWISSVELSKYYFSKKILLSVQEEVPWIVLDYGPSEPSWLVARSGVLLQPTAEIRDNNLQYLLSSLPRLLNQGPQRMNEQQFSWVLRVLGIIDNLGGFPFAISSISFIKGGLELQPENRKLARTGRVLISVENEESILDALKRYSQVRDRLQAEGKVVSVLDLRFSDRVVAK